MSSRDKIFTSLGSIHNRETVIVCSNKSTLLEQGVQIEKMPWKQPWLKMRVATEGRTKVLKNRPTSTRIEMDIGAVCLPSVRVRHFVNARALAGSTTVFDKAISNGADTRLKMTVK